MGASYSVLASSQGLCPPESHLEKSMPWLLLVQKECENNEADFTAT
jgi:hypothetical protein